MKNRFMLYGSRAVSFYHTDFRATKNSDWDFLSLNSDYSHDELYQFNPNLIDQKVEIKHIPVNLLNGYFSDVIDMDTLLTLKVSHTCYPSRTPIKTFKHVRDIEYLLNKGHKVKYDLVPGLFSFWESLKGKRTRLNFDKTNEDFFKDNVTRDIPHDELHFMFMYGNSPAFNLIKSDNTKASVEEDLFKILCFEDKLRVCLEEVFVLAYERKVRPEISFCRLVTHLYPDFISIWALSNVNYILDRLSDYKKFVSKIELNNEGVLHC